MKLSKYTIITDNCDQYIVYNTISDSLMICVPEIIRLIRQYANHINDIQSIHPSLYDYLKEKKFIIPKNLDETQVFIQSLQETLDEGDEVSITINPTMNCNLRCWYCYEKHLAHSNMRQDIMDAIKKLLGDVVIKPKLKSLNLSFFGGEPLLEFYRTVDPIIAYADKICQEHNIELSIGFTSNAVLLSSAICQKLATYNREISFQIPFDGNRQTHNSIKKTAAGKGTYDITLANLKCALFHKFRVTLRCNYTQQSAPLFRYLIEDIQDLLIQYKASLKVAFQQVWQDKEDLATESIINDLKTKIMQIGGSYYESSGDSQRCYADGKNSFVINYNGDIFQCTAREFTEQNREGILKADGKIEYNERYYQRMNTRFSNPECLDCTLFPICIVCTQKRMEIGNNTCIGSNYKDFKKDKLLSRIRALYQLSHS